MLLIAQKNGAVKSTNFKDGFDRIEALTPSPLLPFLFPVLISPSLLSPCDKGIFMKKDYEQEMKLENDGRVMRAVNQAINEKMEGSGQQHTHFKLSFKCQSSHHSQIV